MGVKQSGVVLKYITAAKEAGFGVVFITHNPHHAHMVGDHFVLLNRGRQKLDCTYDDITLEHLTQEMAGGDELHELSHELAEAASDFDYILIDCPPSLGILTINALTAAQEVIIPLQCEALSHRGVGQLIETLADIRHFTNPDLAVFGVIPTMYDGRSLHARGLPAQKTEAKVACKVINIMTGLGMPVSRRIA